MVGVADLPPATLPPPRSHPAAAMPCLAPRRFYFQLPASRCNAGYLPGTATTMTWRAAFAFVAALVVLFPILQRALLVRAALLTPRAGHPHKRALDVAGSCRLRALTQTYALRRQRLYLRVPHSATPAVLGSTRFYLRFNPLPPHFPHPNVLGIPPPVPLYHHPTTRAPTYTTTIFRTYPSPTLPRHPLATAATTYHHPINIT